MVNDSIRIGLQNDISTLKQISKSCYSLLSKYDIISYYKLHAMSKAAAILANRKQSIKRGYQTKTPYLRKGILVSCYGFKIDNGVLKVPLGNRQFFSISLNNHVKSVLSNPTMRVRSFTLTASNTLSICYSQETTEIECITVEGADRNLGNLTIGNNDNRSVRQYDLSKAVDIAENTRSIVRSFRRNDVRIRKIIAGKYGRRRKNRIQQLLHHVSKHVTSQAKENKAAIAFEKLTYLRRLYQKGNYQGRDYRSRMNGWSFAEIKRLITYKAQWKGIPVIQLTSGQTRGTSQLCPRCGKRLQGGSYKDVIHRRQLWCSECKKWMDRDVVAAMNIARKGADVFQRSKGLAGEAMVQELGSTEPIILKVDASKLGIRQRPKTWTEPKKSRG